MSEPTPDTQTIQLNADGPMSSQMPNLIAQALRRARIGGTTKFYDGDSCVAELRPSVETLLELGTLGSQVAKTIKYRTPPSVLKDLKVEPANEELRGELESLLNRLSRENESNTPDFLLTAYLLACLRAWELTTQLRDKWYGVVLEPANSHFE